jgi:peptidoglycan/LPS O-acetylase OafA/YrhL
METNQTKKQTSISIIRFISMSMIVLCHYLQYYNNELAWWFDVGVPIFLCISGFLYGSKTIVNDINFIFKRFKKILLNYYVYLIIIIPFYILFASNLINIKSVISAFICNNIGSIKGLGHLWFIPYILLCYLITPLLFHISEKIKNKSNFIFIISIVGILLLSQVLIHFFLANFVAPLILCYIICYYTAILIKLYGPNIVVKLLLIILPICLLSNSIEIYLKYVNHIELNGVLLMIQNYFYVYTRVCLGITLFLLLYYIFGMINFSKLYIIKKMLTFSDKYSYDIYICHHFYILGPFGFMSLTKNNFINCIIVFIFILISGIILNRICQFIKNSIHKVPA